MSSASEKPAFDKKKWRNQKYSKKVKVDQWQEKRKKYIQGKYFRMLQKDGKLNNPNLEPIGKATTSKRETRLEDKDTKNQQPKKSFRQAKEDFERRKKVAENKQKSDERKKKYLERQAAIENYKHKKAERYKVLSRKTKKGQPLMAGRMEMLLEKIKASS